MSPREISEITKKDRKWYKLKEQLLKVVLSKAEWIRFKRYVNVYFK